MRNTTTAYDLFAKRLMEYADQQDVPVEGQQNELGAGSDELVIPDDLSTLSDDDLHDLHTKASATFDEVFADGVGLSPEDVDALTRLTQAIESLLNEAATREQEQVARDQEAQAMAARVHGELTEQPEDEASADTTVLEEASQIVNDEAQRAVPGAPTSDPERSEIRVSLSGIRSRQRRGTAPRGNEPHQPSMKDIAIAADQPGFTAGAGMDWNDIGRAVDKRLVGFNESQYAAANAAGRHMREQHGVMIINKPFDDGLIIKSTDPEQAEKVIRHAVDEHRLPGGSLVASGGWCAPSTTIYDLFEIESRDGLYSLPTVGVTRGGIKFTPGPDFATIYTGYPGWSVTEAEDIAGDYTPGAGTGGTKPCVKVACPPFTETRLSVFGLCISAGLLQSRGYPEVIARTVRGALIAHDHLMAGKIVAAVEAGSTPVTMTANQVGATAPLLDSIEKQVEHYRYVHRMSRNSTLEAVFPYWVHGVIRGDLSRRQGVDLLDVSDAQIDGWMRQRGVAPQFIYNWQDITGAAGSFLDWPTTVKFLLYAAGTWVQGTQPILTLDTLYDSVLLGTNDYTALWTEDAYLVAKLGHDSRVVTAPINDTGMTGNGVRISNTGIEVAPQAPAADAQSAPGKK